MIGRRQFLKVNAAIVAVCGLGLYGLAGVGAEKEVVATLRRRLGYLQLDADGLQAFAKAHVNALLDKRLPTWHRLKDHLRSAVMPSFARFYRSAEYRSPLERAADSLVSTYLLSSDFFWNDSDETRVVNYRSYYDTRLACGNPFARRPVETSA